MKDYDTSANSNLHHGKSGKAIGAPREQKPMDYDTKTQAEGATFPPVAGHSGQQVPALGGAHQFKPPAAANAHGYGHPAHLRHGPLRMSGHTGAHRLGSRKK